MEINDTDIQLYQKGFNAGYLIAKYAPEISTGLKSESNSSYMDGFADGRKQWEVDKISSYMKWEHPDRQTENDLTFDS